MKRLFLDTNVVIDLLGERLPFYNSIAVIASMSDRKEVELVISALSFSTVYYVLSKYENPTIVRLKLSKIKTLSKISDLTDLIIEKGLISNFSDFEDSLQYYSAPEKNCDIIITRNAKDFKRSELPLMTADEYLVSIK
ncbi:MAG: PIN domain-containing protein [Bacteroidota bacterium]